VDEAERTYLRAPSASMIGLGEALIRLTEDISDQTSPQPAAQTESFIPGFQPEAVAARNHRELAIERLFNALCRDEQRAFVQQEHSGWFQIPAFRWREHPFARDIIISGQWRDVLSRQPHLDGCPVFLVESVFDAWHGQFAGQVESAATATEQPVTQSETRLQPEAPAPEPDASQPEAAPVVEQETPRTRRGRMIVLMQELKDQGLLTAGMKPSDVHGVLAPRYHVRWLGESPLTHSDKDERRTIKRAYDKVFPAAPPGA